ncbi:uncharacterized protein MKK02DRAFT_44534 [Dioszegia hungarica]|uniref:Uncharacterized protein n=1 Tax=Dioszegia hungarica TaxID=4972 RepID=A0AA38HAM5_9TREE|nr:uncharacterized protein MKK02DRAFT_44534 [Dioszegia hungarica]KAI9635839.1 hypothetical protein MKK02DRAFT_44534 [Dioszegia hungarica]
MGSIMQLNQPSPLPVISVSERPLRLDTIPLDDLSPILAILAKSKQFASLASLVRTCKALYQPVIPYIYRDVHIDSQAAYDAILAALVVPASVASVPEKEDARSEMWEGRFLSHCALTRRVTLSTMPNIPFGVRLSQILGDTHLGPKSLFPLAKLLHICPTNLPADTPQQSPSLTSLCTPQQVCFTEDSSKLGTGSRIADWYPLLESIGSHAVQQSGHGPVELDWHGSEATLYDAALEALHSGLCNTSISYSFDRVRLHVPDPTAAFGYSYERLRCTGATTLIATWAEALYVMTSPQLHHPWTARRSTWVINVATSCSASTVRLHNALCDAHDPVIMVGVDMISLLECWIKVIRHDGTQLDSQTARDIASTLVTFWQLRIQEVTTDVVRPWTAVEVARYREIRDAHTEEDIGRVQGDQSHRTFEGHDFQNYIRNGREVWTSPRLHLEMKMGDEQEPCPVCAYHPY